MLVRKFNRIRPIRSFSDHTKIIGVVQNCDECAADQSVIINDKNGDWESCGHACFEA